jgi:Ring finger domain
MVTLNDKSDIEGVNETDEFFDKEIVKTVCGHTYCLPCLERWLQVKNECAMCGEKCYSISKKEDDCEEEVI